MSVRINTPMINRAKVRQYALTVAAERAHRFTRVGDEFYQQCEANLKQFIAGSVRRLPSMGKTIK